MIPSNAIAGCCDTFWGMKLASSFRGIESFLVVAEELHFGRAAARLHISQPPLSRQIKRLERDLGLELFYRSRRGISLTEAGHVFVREVHRASKQLEFAVQAAAKAQHGQTGKLVIGFDATTVSDVTAHAVWLYQTKFPEVEVSLVDLATAELLRAVQGGQVDLGFAVGGDLPKGLEARPVMRERLVLLLAEENPLSKTVGRVKLKAIAGEKLLMCPREHNPPLFDQIIRMCQQSGFTPHLVQGPKETRMMLALVSAGAAVALAPSSISNYLRPGVSCREIQAKGAEMELSVVWPKGRDCIRTRHFLEAVDKAGRKLNTARHG